MCAWGVCCSKAGAAGGADGEDPNNTTVFVGGIDATITEEILRESFAPFGEVGIHESSLFHIYILGATGLPGLALFGLSTQSVGSIGC